MIETKNNPLADETENKPDSLFKHQINNFLINYFNHLILIVAFIIFVAGLFLFVFPQYQAISKSNRAAEKNLRIEYEANLNYLNKINNLKESYQRISVADRKKIETMVPFDDNIIGLIPEIESIVIRNGAILNSIKVELVEGENQPGVMVEPGERQEPVEGIFSGQLPGGVKLVKMEVNLGSADYQVLKNIIKTCENNLRLLDVAKISYTVSEGRVVLTIYSYYLQ